MKISTKYNIPERELEFELYADEIKIFTSLIINTVIIEYTLGNRFYNIMRKYHLFPDKRELYF